MPDFTVDNISWQFEHAGAYPMSNNEVFDVSVPIETDNGKIIWHRVGIYFKNHDSNKKHDGVLQLHSIPVGAQAPLKMFLYPREQYNRSQHKKEKQLRNPNKFDDWDTPF